jgi:hypothetical protein
MVRTPAATLPLLALAFATIVVTATPPALSAQGATLIVPSAGDTLGRESAAGDSSTIPPDRERERLKRRAAFDPSFRPGPSRRPAPGGQPHPSPLGTARGAFGVSVETDAQDYVVWDAEYTEPMRIRVTSAADGYLTLLSGGVGPRLFILAPNDLVAQLPVRAGETVEFPLREWTHLGVELRPQLPEGQDSSQQAIIAVVTRRPFALPPFDYDGLPASPNTISARTFQLWLGRIPPGERGVGQTYYLVRRP